MPPPARARARTYLAYFAVWTVVGLYFWSEDLSRHWLWRDPTPWWRFLASWTFGVWVFAAITPAVLWLGRRFPLDGPRWGPRWLLHLGLSISVAIAHVALSAVVVPRLGVLGPLTPKTFGDALAILGVLSLHGNVLSYWTILGVQYGWRTYHRYQERERAALRLEAHTAALTAQLSRAQLAALKMQLQPHFLFNTLNAIMVLVRQRDTALAEETLARLSDLLRCVLDDVDSQEVPLRRELHYVQLYLAIEELRFADRLRVEIDSAEELGGAAIPPMALQPLVENAIRHGISQRSEAGLVRISARRVSEQLAERLIERLIVCVEDDGPGVGAPSGDRGGIGLTNTRARLYELYGDEARLTLEARPAGGALATLTLPFRLASDLPVDVVGQSRDGRGGTAAAPRPAPPQASGGREHASPLGARP